ncbi:ABC transporter permease [Nocardioides guangzhouensis]|uniref:Xylose transport system permease protein XylH n=1 Tax=Nocardioides guangzhouensis TaxID=2497878 RepID=A0A4Q4ZCL5_9ACTN|nr:ABC transporter permease [Nocardioides guangzhouensis]RYP84914.1 ABC transporter permease [Nocardioides guangzhouensis]
MSTTTTPAPSAPTPPVEEAHKETLGTIARDYVTKVRGGDVGSLPAVLGLIFLVIVFTSLRGETFTNQFNFANLFNQSAGVMVIAMGLVFVLLLGEIDLSAGFTAGTCAAVIGVCATERGWPWYLAILAGIATGAVIGLLIGLLVARLGIPSFVVTLAAFLGLQGVMLLIIGEGGTIPYRDDKLLAIMNKNLPVWLGWTLCIVGILAYGLVTYLRVKRRLDAGLGGGSLQLWALKTGAVAVVLLWMTYYFNLERSRNPALISLKGVPIVVVILFGLLVVLTFMLSRTAWGRHVYAVGGNAEAARRAGIAVAQVKLSCFMMCSSLAAVAGLLIASRDNSVSPSTGGSLTLLYAVGAAVIGGTSLFGGKGRIMDAVIGGLVIAVINNGMLMLDQPSGRVYLVTGLVLLLAASVDAISRRKARASGRV